jgi:hypothetical protein
VPRHIRNILIAALLALLALAAGINGYIHHQFKTNIDNTLSSIQFFAQVKYSDLSTSIFSGEVKLENVRVSSDFLPEEIKLGNITLETPGFAYMLNGPESMKKGILPKNLGFKIDGFYLNLDGETADWLNKLVDRMQPVYASERKLCGGKSIFGPADYKKMGYTSLSSNMRLAYDFNETNKTLNINIAADTKKMGNMEARINIINISGISPDTMTQGGMPQLASIEATYEDGTYTERVIKYCAELSGMNREDFIDAEIKQSDKYFYMVWGFAPGEGLRDAYKDFLLKSDSVTLSMSPATEFNPMMASVLSTDEIMQLLNVTLSINGLPVTDLDFKMPPAEFTKNFEQQLANTLDFNALLKGEPIKTRKVIKKTKVYKKAPAKYHKISLRKAPQHVGNFVRITTKKGSQRKGRLIRINNTNLYVQKKVNGGKFTMTVPREKIKTIEAYFSK